MKKVAEAQPCTNMKDTLIIDGCPYEVDLCVYCGLSYPGYAIINSVRPLTNCNSTLDRNELMQLAYTQLATTASIWLNYCQTLLPPCSTQTRTIMKWRMPVCWYAKLEFSIPGANNDRHIILPCEDPEYCEIEYEYCIDDLGIIHSDPTNTVFPVIPNCVLEGNEVILPDDFIGSLPGDESDCFILHTPCNPDDFEWND